MIINDGRVILHLQNDVVRQQVLSSVSAKHVQVDGKNLVVCRHTWQNVERLRRLDLKVPSPFHYGRPWQYTGCFTPMDHQKKTVEFLVENPRAFVLSDMGTGKTSAALWAAEYLLQQGVIKNVLIISPLSCLKPVWLDEIFNITPHRSSCIIYGFKRKRLSLLKDKYTFNIINHDGVNVVAEDIKGKFDLIIVDEAAIYRNPNQRYKIFREIAKKAPRVWLMTGTPAPNAPTDVWALIKLVTPTFTSSFGAFRELTMKRLGQFTWVPKDNSTELIYQFMKPAIRFRKEDCLDLPSLAYVNRECVLNVEQKKAYDLMRKSNVMNKTDGQKITAANAAVALIKILQIVCGVIRDNDQQFYHFQETNRLSLLEECIREAGKKAIVFIPFIGVMGYVKDYLTKQKINCEIVNGEVSQSARQRVFDDFQKGSLEVLLAHPKTTAHGLTLTAASTIIWFSPIFSVEQYIQANARIHRAGQTKACTIVHLGATKMEWELYAGLNHKIEMQKAILKQYEEVYSC